MTLSLLYNLPLTQATALDILTELGACVHANGETVNRYGSRLENIFNQIDELGYKTINDLKLAFHQRRSLQDVYAQHKSLFWIKDQLQNEELHLMKN